MVFRHPSEKYDFVNWDDENQPAMSISDHFQTPISVPKNVRNHQPVYLHYVYYRMPGKSREVSAPAQGAAVTRMATMAFFTWSMTSAHSAEIASATVFFREKMAKWREKGGENQWVMKADVGSSSWIK